MRTVMLQTRQGEDVQRVGIIASSDENLPGVIVWGAQVFSLMNARGIRFPGEDWLPVYRETFGYWVPGAEKLG